LAWSPRSRLAHCAKGQVLRAQRRYAEAIPEYEAVLASNRNSVYSFAYIGQCKLWTGSIEETIPLFERAIRLSPRHPFALGFWYEEMGFVHLRQSRFDEAIFWLERTRDHFPAGSFAPGGLAAYALADDTERARAELAEVRKLSPDDRYSSIARLQASRPYWGVPKIRALVEATFFAGLRKAGMPEE
jgi:tetratricopeptide (TPR) repeat protein